MTLGEFEANLSYFTDRFEIQELIIGGGEISDRPDPLNYLRLLQQHFRQDDSLLSAVALAG